MTFSPLQNCKRNPFSIKSQRWKGSWKTSPLPKQAIICSSILGTYEATGCYQTLIYAAYSVRQWFSRGPSGIAVWGKSLGPLSRISKRILKYSRAGLHIVKQPASPPQPSGMAGLFLGWSAGRVGLATRYTCPNSRRTKQIPAAFLFFILTRRPPTLRQALYGPEDRYLLVRNCWGQGSVLAVGRKEL